MTCRLNAEGVMTDCPYKAHEGEAGDGDETQWWKTEDSLSLSELTLLEKVQNRGYSELDGNREEKNNNISLSDMYEICTGPIVFTDVCTAEG